MQNFLVGTKAKIKYKVSPLRTVEFECKVVREEYDRLAITFPQDMHDFAQYFLEGQTLEIVLYTSRGVRVLESLIIDSPLVGEFVIEYYDDATSVQRRQFVRADLNAEIMLYQTEKGQKNFKTRTINIGGGGIRFKTDQILEKSSKWKFSVYLPNIDFPIRGEGEIIHMFKKQDPMASVLKFSSISEPDRNRIIKKCFELESKRIKKELEQVD